MTRAERFRSLSFSKVVPRALLTATAFSFLGALNAGLHKWIHNASTLEVISQIVCFFVYGFLATFLAWRPQAAWWVAAISTTSVVMSIMVLIFYPPAYASFLRSIGYGGGIQVTVELKVDGGKHESISGFLLLRSGSAIMLLDQSGRSIREVPYSEVKYLRHSALPFRRMPFKLPEGNS